MTSARWLKQHRACPPPPPKGSSFFLSGVMCGGGTGTSSALGLSMEIPQDYRAELRNAITAADASAQIIDPLVLGEERAAQLFPPGTPREAIWADDRDVRAMLAFAVEAAASADVVVSFLPSASMGSALELHEARRAGRLIAVIAPGGVMRENWVVRSYSDVIFEDISQLSAWLARGEPGREPAP